MANFRQYARRGGAHTRNATPRAVTSNLIVYQQTATIETIFLAFARITRIRATYLTFARDTTEIGVFIATLMNEGQWGVIEMEEVQQPNASVIRHIEDITHHSVTPFDICYRIVVRMVCDHPFLAIFKLNDVLARQDWCKFCLIDPNQAEWADEGAQTLTSPGFRWE